MTNYFHQQLIPALRGEREITASHRLAIIGNMLLQVSLPTVLIISGIWVNGWQISHSRRLWIISGALWLAGSLPLIVTLKQRTFYTVPSLAFYSIAGAALILPIAAKLIVRAVQQTFIKMGLAITIVTLIFYLATIAGDIRRDASLITTVTTMGKQFPPNTVIAVNVDSCQNWKLIAYFARYQQISLSCAE